MSQSFLTNSVRVTDDTRYNCQYPALALDGGSPILCWQSYREKSDQLMLAPAGGEASCISLGGQALQPRGASAPSGAWFIWSEFADGLWTVVARGLCGGKLTPPVLLAQDTALFYPSLTAWNDRLVALWCRQTPGESRVMLRTFSPDGTLDETLEVSGGGEAYRPSAVQGQDGKLYLAYDRYVGGSYQVAARTLDGQQLSFELEVSDSPWWATAPRLVPVAGGAGLAWYEVGPSSQFSYCYATLSAGGGTLTASQPEVVTRSANWYNNLELTAGADGTVYLAYTWGKYNVHLRHKKAGGGWSDPTILSFNDGHCAIRPAMAADGDGMLHYVWQFANRNGHLHRNASVIYNRISGAELAASADGIVETVEDKFVAPIPGEKPLVLPPHAVRTAWLERQGLDHVQVCFGDIHGHSTVSDAMGEVDQYYHYARDVRSMDLTALTDHDCYPDTLSTSEWFFLQAQARLFNQPGRLAVLLGYEWTSNEYRYDFGHKNIYYPHYEGGLFPTTEEDGYTPDRLFAHVRAAGGMAIPHHPSVDWSLVSAATDWQFHDPEVQRVCEIFSRHADFEHYESVSPFTKNIRKIEGCSCDDALAQGKRIGFIAGSDSHQMEAGKEGGILAAYLPECTPDALYRALYDRRVYGTTGAGILMVFTANGAHMGSELTAIHGAEVRLCGQVLGTAQVKAMELICNNQVVCTVEPGGEEGELRHTATLTDSAFYYLKITQVDGHMAWSSPIWIDVEKN